MLNLSQPIIVRIKVKNPEAYNLIAFGEKLGKASGWTEYWIDEGDEDNDEETFDSDYIMVAVEFPDQQIADTFRAQFNRCS